MKLILSRKGFDSANGKIPSPIFPDGKAFSLPILTSDSTVKIENLRYENYDISQIVHDLSNGSISKNRSVHLDPDIDRCVVEKEDDAWRGAFGQTGSAQSHLNKQQVNIGDMFLYFGWFKAVEKVNGRWQYIKHAPDLHIIFGWLKVEKILTFNEINSPSILFDYPWLSNHPHLSGYENDHFNTIYIGANKLDLFGIESDGYGVFQSLKEEHILTDRDQPLRSVWKLPGSMMPSINRQALSYHGNLSRWKEKDSNWVNLRSVGRGQEFVLDMSEYDNIEMWIRDMFL